MFSTSLVLLEAKDLCDEHTKTSGNSYLADQVADQLADLPPVEASSGQEWQFEISTVRAHIGRSTGRSPPIETSSGQELN